MNFIKISSNLFGLLSSIKFPKLIQNFLNKSYIKFFHIDMSEFKDPSEYESLNALFARALQEERVLEEGIISPCDGKVLQSGSAFMADNELFAFAIKGHTYSLETLLKGSFESQELQNGLDYLNIYLAPKDYHRYHAPCDLEILSATYTDGALYSVNEKYICTISNLYAKNERVSLKCRSIKGLFWLVFIGARNVGKMRFHFDTSIQTNAKKNHNFTTKYDNLLFQKGQELGYFELGSTVVFIAQKGQMLFKEFANNELKFGAKIAEFIEIH
ncbi:phosphatidylserine decarboxylase [Campylobacter sp. MIT 21-1685]|uniref:phosphatidylserine decarboxylase n=1 Tax=unclassified Campylobacter TaxID=2593542 RepID=UPI00224A5713|nr:MULTISPECIES: phosphatidylserine decarboxylase [unclassified Campylobacter]MCX2682753.1 phosphatidylserine decarboxylase [Campylobacter sp. MIT 21-1684]MCX2751101.1 phosphatidylserine decarboxylase [Campylobacter sp. MIT 21-1682]MCX2807234.1 phosphatidylserine decarboxylase [Campylobacter sp. MIT 21-1685]